MHNHFKYMNRIDFQTFINILIVDKKNPLYYFLQRLLILIENYFKNNMIYEIVINNCLIYAMLKT